MDLNLNSSQTQFFIGVFESKFVFSKFFIGELSKNIVANSFWTKWHLLDSK